MGSKTLISGGQAVGSGRRGAAAGKPEAATPGPKAAVRWAGARGAPGKGLWLTREELGLGVGLTPMGVKTSLEPQLRDADFWHGRPRRIRLRAVLDVLEARAVERAQGRRNGGPAPLGPADLAPTLALAGGPTSPVGPLGPDADLEAGPPTEALERMRLLRGDLLELEKKRLLGELLTRAEVEDSLAAVRQTLRGMADALSRSHPGAAEIVADALAELARAAGPSSELGVASSELEGNREGPKTQSGVASSE